MSYDNPLTCTYNFPVMDFGAAAGATTHQIAGPEGMTGVLKEVGVCTTEAFACDATNAHVQVGIIGDLDAYAKLNVPDLALINTVVNSADDTDAIISAAVAADTAVQITLTEGTDGTGVTGQGQVYVIVDWS